MNRFKHWGLGALVTMGLLTATAGSALADCGYAWVYSYVYSPYGSYFTYLYKWACW
jgi:hypothetical protein